METINENLLFFKKECSIRNLILGKDFNDNFRKRIKPLVLASIILIQFSFVVNLFKSWIAYPIFFTGSIGLLIFIIIDSIFVRNELKNLNMPYSKIYLFFLMMKLK